MFVGIFEDFFGFRGIDLTRVATINGDAQAFLFGWKTNVATDHVIAAIRGNKEGTRDKILMFAR